MKQPILKKSEGFTIIEVLIVLAIGGLIMLIVFLAVPALQRNSRNTQYRNEASAYAGAVSEWSNNNNGKVPTTTDLTNINSLAKLNKMTAPTSVGTGSQSDTVATGTLRLVTSAKCDTATVGSSIGTTSRSSVIRFSVETSGSNVQNQCIEV